MKRLEYFLTLFLALRTASFMLLHAGFEEVIVFTFYCIPNQKGLHVILCNVLRYQKKNLQKQSRGKTLSAMPFRYRHCCFFLFFSFFFFFFPFSFLPFYIFFFSLESPVPQHAEDIHVPTEPLPAKLSEYDCYPRSGPYTTGNVQE